MPKRYVFSVVRCVPDPRTGEFVNVGAIAGDPESEDWSVRQVSSESHVRRLAGAEALGAVHGFLADVGFEIDRMQAPTFDSGDLPGEAWLEGLFHDHRNLVQLSQPAPILADDAEQALDVLFKRQVIDPVTQPRQRIITKHRVLRDLRLAYLRAQIDPRRVQRRVELFVGDRVHTSLDYAVANGVTVQLTQGWSFQGSGIDAVSEQVKAWAYAISRLREGQSSRVLGLNDWVSRVDGNVDLEVVVVPPETPEQTEVYEEARQIFDQLEASVHDLKEVDVVGRRAADLLGQKSSDALPPFRD